MYKNIPSEYLTIILNENLLSYKSNGPAGSPSSSSSSDSMNVILWEEYNNNKKKRLSETAAKLLLWSNKSKLSLEVRVWVLRL